MTFITDNIKETKYGLDLTTLSLNICHNSKENTIFGSKWDSEHKMRVAATHPAKCEQEGWQRHTLAIMTDNIKETKFKSHYIFPVIVESDFHLTSILLPSAYAEESTLNLIVTLFCMHSFGHLQLVKMLDGTRAALWQYAVSL